MFYVYILYSNKCNRYYVGYSKNPENRLSERHNEGAVKATRFCTPDEIMATKGYESETEARKEEYRIKKMKSRIYIETLINKGW